MRLPQLITKSMLLVTVLGLLPLGLQAIPVISISGNYKDTLVNDPVNGPSVSTAGSDSVLVKALPMSGVDITGFDTNSQFSLQAGPLSSINNSLGDDPTYKPGKTSAKFNDFAVSGAIVTVSWTATTLTATAIYTNDAWGAEGAFGTPGMAGVTPFTNDVTVSVSLDAFSSPEYDFSIIGKNTDREVGDTNVGTTSLESGSFSGAADFTPPTLTAAAPKKTGTDGTILLHGTASDNVLVADIFFVLNNDGNTNTIFDEDDSEAIKATNWSITIDTNDFADELEGLNTASVFAVDTSGNQSKIVNVTFDFAALATLSLSTNGAGGVRGLSDGEQLLTGNTYPVTALPAGGWIFVGWTNELGDLVSTSAKYNFVMYQGAGLAANFFPNPLPAKSASFVGLFSDEVNGVNPTNSGYAIITVTHSGAWTGTLYVGPTPHSLTGQFRGDFNGGDVDSTIVINPKTHPLLLDLTLQAATSPDDAMSLSLTAFSDKAETNVLWTATDGGVGLKLCAPVSPAPTAGRYNMVLPGLPATNDSGVVVSNGPYGYGYASMTLGVKGGISVVAHLPDSSPAITFSTLLADDGTFPFFVSLYKGNGLYEGWFQFTNDATTGFQVETASSDTNVWIALPGALNAYPGGFSSLDTPFTLMAGGDLYVAPKKLANIFGAATLDFMLDIAGAADATTNSYTYNPVKNTFAINPPQKLTFAPATGVLTGSLYFPQPTRRAISGIYLPQLQTGYGFMSTGIPITFTP